MMKNILFLISFLTLTGCATTKNQTELIASPLPLIVYKTKGDYYKLVPVQLNKERTDIISYPGPGDLIFEGKPALPTRLGKGYLLDNRGVNRYTAFTSYTYEEYSKMNTAPSREELLNHIIDADPFTDLFDCGKRTGENASAEALKHLINNDFNGCKDLLKE